MKWKYLIYSGLLIGSDNDQLHRSQHNIAFVLKHKLYIIYLFRQTTAATDKNMSLTQFREMKTELIESKFPIQKQHKDGKSVCLFGDRQRQHRKVDLRRMREGETDLGGK